MRAKKIFFSYSKKDRQYLDEFLRQLTLLTRSGKIAPWDDSKIMAGGEWNAVIQAELASADIIVLMVSADFLATDYIWNEEIPVAMRRHQSNQAIVVPVILRPCAWESAPFSILNALPTKAKPVSSYDDRDVAWLEVVKGIERLIEMDHAGHQVDTTFNTAPKDTSIQKSQVKMLIAEGRLKEGLEHLNAVAPKHLQNEVLMLLARYSRLERDERLGIMATSDANIERNRITAAALSILN